MIVEITTLRNPPYVMKLHNSTKIRILQFLICFARNLDQYNKILKK